MEMKLTSCIAGICKAVVPASRASCDQLRCSSICSLGGAAAGPFSIIMHRNMKRRLPLWLPMAGLLACVCSMCVPCWLGCVRAYWLEVAATVTLCWFDAGMVATSILQQH